MARRALQEINAGSMADIAFLLLIFFLVTTTMDVDSGILRKLPPIEENEEEDQKDVKERNVLIVLINKDNLLAVEGELTDISELKDLTKEFVENPLRKENLSERRDPTEIDFFGMVETSKGVVSLQNDKSTEYGKYIEVQNELMAAFNELRNEIAVKQFGIPYDDLEKDKQKAIRKYYPLTISEAEPRNIGGGK